MTSRLIGMRLMSFDKSGKTNPAMTRSFRCFRVIQKKFTETKAFKSSEFINKKGQINLII